MRGELEAIGLPADLVQIIPSPVTKDSTEALMRACDLVVVTGSQDNVRRAYSSGTPAIGVGAGNVPVMIDETADLDAAAAKIRDSKIFDNSTSCSPRTRWSSWTRSTTKRSPPWNGPGLSVHASGEAAHRRAAVGARQAQPGFDRQGRRRSGARLRPAAGGKRKAVLPRRGGGDRRGAPFSGEKLALVLTVYRAKDFADAKRTVERFSTTRARAIPAASTPPTWPEPGNSPKTSTWCAYW